MLVADRDAPRGERAKLLDFGIVKVLQEVAAAPSDDIEGQTQRGMILGTPLYMAPEQWKNQRNIDGKTDVYSLAVMMFLVLTGRMPFRAPDTPGLLFLHCHKAPPSMDSIDPTLPAALVELVAKMLAKDPKHRPTMEQVGTTLGQILTQPAAPRSQPLLPEPTDLELIADNEGEESSGVRIGRLSAMSGDHQPLVDSPLPSQANAAALISSSQLLPAPTAAEIPGWEDDNVATASLAAVVPDRPTTLPGIVPGRLSVSDQSLLVGSQYDLRPVVSSRAWISTGALLAVMLLIVVVNVFHLSPLPLRPTRTRPAVAEVAPVPPPPAPAPSPPAPVVVAKAKLKKNCQHMMPSAACVGSQHLTAAQQAAVLASFLRSDASLCPGDRLVLSGLPAAPRLEVMPKSMARKARTNLLRDLKDLPGSLALPAQLEVLCPDP